ncbi:Pol polyprotein [Elysia marginata]|uniref:Pol polyprotein n=1 Tax=Elysia marginata TaxID=1093978 RepID=A0AAV4F3B2_9GAST|nr:Pol polyprotein [Elysia marginata]
MPRHFFCHFTTCSTRQPRQVTSWAAEMEAAFTSCKAALAEVPMLSHPKPDAQISVTTDASDQTGGAVLQHYVRGIAYQLEVQLHRTTAYHPPPNDLAELERFHRTLKGAFKARLEELPWVLLGLRVRNHPKEDLGSSAAELVYEVPLCVSGEFIDPLSNPLYACTPNDPLHTTVKKLSPSPTSRHGLPSSTAVPQSLHDARFVFIRHDGHRGPLRRPYDGSFLVIVPGDKTFRIMVGEREEIISTDRLKPAHVDLIGPVPVAQPPRRGRPPLQPAEPANRRGHLSLNPHCHIITLAQHVQGAQYACLHVSGDQCHCWGRS